MNVKAKVFLRDGPERLRAFADVTLDECFIVHAVKVIVGDNGPFIAMPAVPLRDRCRCGHLTAVQARFCEHCGAPQPPLRYRLDRRGKPKLFADIAHPLTPAFRLFVERAVLSAYYAELEAQKAPMSEQGEGTSGVSVA